jgi:hypothetical protein
MDPIFTGLVFAAGVGVTHFIHRVFGESTVKAGAVSSNYGYTGPLDIDKIARLIEDGSLPLSKPSTGNIVAINTDKFSFEILTMGWRWTENKEKGVIGFTAKDGYHAAMYNYGEGKNYFSLSKDATYRISQAVNSQVVEKIDEIFEQINVDKHNSVIKNLESKGVDK